MIPSNSVSSLEIYLLGIFQVRVNGLAVDKASWKRRSAVKLIKLLALTPEHRIHREQLMEILWGDNYSENQSNNLNKTIYDARRALQPELHKASDSQFILSENQQVCLISPDKVFVDAVEFEKLAQRGIRNENLKDCEGALDLYRGDLLVEDIYEDYATSRREHLRVLHRKLVTKTAEIYSSQQRFERGIELLKNLSLNDPTDERVHQELMRLYALTGSKYQALKQFEICRKTLAELGFTPEPKTLAIKTDIQAGKIQPIDSSAAPPAAKETAQSAEKNASLFRTVPAAPRVKRLTFNQGVVQSARFMKDAAHILYSAAWEETDFEIYKIHRDKLVSEPTGIRRSGILAISRTGEIAVSHDRRFVRGYKSTGTLSGINSTEGKLQKILENIEWADWHPRKSGSRENSVKGSLAIVRTANGRNRLEYPVGKVLFETGGWISHPRFSPAGEKIAFIHHPIPDDDSGEVVSVDLAAGKRVLSEKWISLQGLVWRKTGDEIWFTGTREGNLRAIYAVDLKGTERLVYKGTGSVTLHDLADDGSALITHDKTQIKIAARGAGDAEERDLTFHDWSLVRDISPDGSSILFTEAGESGGALYAAYIREMNGSQTKKLGEGSALALSPNGRFALVKLGTSPARLAVYEIATGERRFLETTPKKSFIFQPWACWFPDGKKILFAANEAESGTRLYEQEIDAGAPLCLTPEAEGFEISTPHAISPDGASVLVIHPNRRIYLLSAASGKLTALPDLEPDHLGVGWSADGEKIFMRERGQVPAIIFSYDLKTGKRETVLKLIPHYRTGVHEILRVLLTPDRSAYAYSYTREFSDLMIIEGLA